MSLILHHRHKYVCIIEAFAMFAIVAIILIAYMIIVKIQVS